MNHMECWLQWLVVNSTGAVATNFIYKMYLKCHLQKSAALCRPRCGNSMSQTQSTCIYLWEHCYPLNTRSTDNIDETLLKGYTEVLNALISDCEDAFENGTSRNVTSRFQKTSSRTKVSVNGTSTLRLLNRLIGTSSQRYKDAMCASVPLHRLSRHCAREINGRRTLLQWRHNDQHGISNHLHSTVCANFV